MFQKGHEKIGGRQKGTQNKTSTEIRKKCNYNAAERIRCIERKAAKTK